MTATKTAPAKPNTTADRLRARLCEEFGPTDGRKLVSLGLGFGEANALWGTPLFARLSKHAADAELSAFDAAAVCRMPVDAFTTAGGPKPDRETKAGKFYKPATIARWAIGKVGNADLYSRIGMSKPAR